MRILHVTPGYVPAWRFGGPIGAVHGLARALVSRGHDVEVFTTNADASGELAVPTDRAVDVDGVRVRYFRVGFPRRLFRAPELRRALARTMGDRDLVHTHSIFLWPTLAAARAAQAARVPYLVSPRGMLVRDLFRSRGRLRKLAWMRLYERATLERAAGIVVSSPIEGREAQGFGLRLPPLFEVPNGIDPARFAEDPGQSPPALQAVRAARPFLLFLGRLSWKKGLDRLIEALPHVLGVHLIVAGNDDEGLRPGLEAQARELGIAERIHFAGPVDLPQKVALLRAAEALVLPSRSENFGNVVLEAMAAGCPAVVSPEVGLAPVLEETGAGVVVQAEPARLAGRLSELLADAARLAEMRGRGPRVVAERYTWETVAARMEDVYRSVLSTTRGIRP